MEDVDHVAARVTVATGIGAALGSSVAVYKGHSIQRVAGSMALSWAMVATACLGTQRLASVAARRFLRQDDENIPTMVATHAIGGIVGGGLSGYLYIRKPIRGMVFLTPIMLMVSLAEMKFQERRKIRPEDIPIEHPTRTIDGGVVGNKGSAEEKR